MIRNKVRNVEIVVPTVLAVVLAIVLSIGAIYLTEIFLGRSSRLKPISPSPAAAELLRCQTLTGDFRAFTCCFPE
jgi:hypothetical protein